MCWMWRLLCRLVVLCVGCGGHCAGWSFYVLGVEATVQVGRFMCWMWRPLCWLVVLCVGCGGYWWWCRPHPVREHAQDLRPPLGARPASPPTRQAAQPPPRGPSTNPIPLVSGLSVRDSSRHPPIGPEAPPAT